MTGLPTDSLASALSAQELEIPQSQIEQLDAYCRLLWDWNAKINLTRHTDYEKFVARDVIDSMQLANVLRAGEEILDVGSGGGVPGIPLAILRPDLKVSLSESIRKKSQVLNEMVESLGLEVAVYACRAEEVLDEFRFDSLVARAVGPLTKILTWLNPYWPSIGRLLAIKGPRWQDEVAEAARQLAQRKLIHAAIAQYRMPGTESDSVILEIRSESRETSR